MHTTNYNNIKNIYFVILIQIGTLCAQPISSFGQDQKEIQIANEYVLKGEKDKALALYSELAKKTENNVVIYNVYFNLLLDTENFKQAEEYLEKILRRDSKVTYQLDLGVLYVRSGDLTKADKFFKNIIKSESRDAYRLKAISDHLSYRNLTEYAILALLQARNSSNNASLYTLELANLYRMSGKRDQMVEEYLNYVTQTPANIAYIKNLMQILLTKPEELESLEKLLLDRAQKNQNSEVYVDLLIWVNLQQKNFYGAFIQARAYDKRFRKEQSKTMEIANIALNNEDYENADKAFAYVIKEFANTENELPARLGLIRAREAKVKKNYPVNTDSVKYLVSEYKKFIASYSNQASGQEAILNEALLRAYYLDEKDSAVVGLNRLVTGTRASPSLKAKAKIELGDIYLLKEEPWEATLLYSQVEKSQRETPLGYEAKLRNAKLSYFKGDFLLAQEHLDILKQATTREIANDAMELSMRIKENTAFDSLGTALKEYASIELLLAQNKNEQALERLQNFKPMRKVKMPREEALRKGLWSPEQKMDEDELTKLKSQLERQKINPTSQVLVGDSVWVDIEEQLTSIRDDVYWLEANIRLKQGEFSQSIALLEKIVIEFGEDILSDDAYFLQGELYEIHLKDKDKAMEIYREFLNRYPGSVYAAEARKRYRQLRGDFSDTDIIPKF